MKTKIVLLISALFLMTFSIDALAQRGRRAPDVRPRQPLHDRPVDRPEPGARVDAAHCLMLPELTEAQEQEIRALRLARIERSTKHRSEMAELRARKRNMMTGVSEGDVDALIDEITGLRGAHMKENVRHHQAVRDLLTEEQRILYDSKVMRRGGGREGLHRPAAGRDRDYEPRSRRGRW